MSVVHDVYTSTWYKCAYNANMEALTETTSFVVQLVGQKVCNTEVASVVTKQCLNVFHVNIFIYVIHLVAILS